MSGAQIYNLAWLLVWVAVGVMAAVGVASGNPAHWVYLCGSAVFACLLLTGKEDGESLLAALRRLGSRALCNLKERMRLWRNT